MSRIARSTSGSETSERSQTRAALLAARFAWACATPDTSLSAFSTLLTQAAQCMPLTGMVTRPSTAMFDLAEIVLFRLPLKEGDYSVLGLAQLYLGEPSSFHHRR